MKIIGEIMVFKNRNGNGYYTTTNNKQEDGTFDKNFITVGFKKGVEVENFTKIDIKDAFLTHYSFEDENGKIQKKFKIMVMDFGIIQTYSSSNQNNADNEMADIYPDDDGLPF